MPKARRYTPRAPVKARRLVARVPRPLSSVALTDGRLAVIGPRTQPARAVTAHYTLPVTTTGAGLLTGFGFSLGGVISSTQAWGDLVASGYDEFAAISLELSYQPRSLAINSANPIAGGAVVALLPTLFTPPAITVPYALAEYRSKHVNYCMPWTIRWVLPAQSTTTGDRVFYNTTSPASLPGCINYAQDGTPWANASTIGDLQMTFQLLVRGQK